MKQICLSLGANLGHPEETLRAVITDMLIEEVIFNLQVSSMYETPPVGDIEQPNYFNLAIIAQTNLEPLELLDYVQELEARYGRERTLHWGPRTLDIDIIDIEGQVLDTERLTLPHPEASKRAFVLIGLAELSANYPIAGKPVKDWLAGVSTENIIELEDEM